MQEKEFINQIQSLRGVKPSEAWVKKTERNILGERKSVSFSWSPVLASLAVIVMVLAGVAGYHYLPRHQELAEESGPSSSEVASLVPSLENLKIQIDKTSQDLKELPPTASLSLEKKAVIQQTIETSQQIVEKVKALDKEKSLSALTSEMGASAEGLMAEFTYQEIERLRQQAEKGFLPAEEVEALAQIEDLMAKGQAEEAFYQLLLLENGNSPQQ